MRMINKKGIEAMYGLIFKLILGIAVVLVVFGLFVSNNIGDEVDVAVCRESLAVRAQLPDVESWGLDFWSFKDKWPLKCQTSEVKIDYNDTAEAERHIMETIAGCWNLVGRGEFDVFPVASWSVDSYCFVCARIHFEPEVRKFYEGENQINLKSALNKRLSESTLSYKQFLTGKGHNPSLISGKFKEDFEIIEDRNVFTSDTSVVYLPELIEISKGDLFVTFSSWVIDSNNSTNQLFFYQDNSGENVEELTQDKIVDEWSWFPDAIERACGKWEGIPA
jgi:hypothetical protein